MSNVTTKLVTPTRLKQLLDSYGGSPSSWPEDERQAALTLLKGSTELSHYRDQVQTLDNQLAQVYELERNTIDETTVQSLQQRILNQLPNQLPNKASPDINDNNDNAHSHKSDGPIAGHVRHPRHSRIWMGSIAASLFIVSLSTGVIYQTFVPSGDTIKQPASDVAMQEFALWAWEDITGESLAVNTDNEPTTLLALMDMELPAE